jgi:predicted O-methyltransferase YrrM
MELDQNNFYAALINGVNAHVLGKKTDSYDILTFANIQAAFESARYYNDHMSKAKNIESDLALLTHAMGMRTFDGQILEFGVASGRTINHLSSLTERTVYGFDVFTGLPETWRTGFAQGAFGRNDLPEVNHNVELVVGLFDETLDGFLKSNNEAIALLHVDCDLYGGTKTIFEKLGDFITSGTVIVFDEYFNYPGWSQHEYKAFHEFVSQKNIKYRYDSFVSKHQQVCVVIE